jgi:nicotinate-nucleotide pyrophosphorylase (carboxylating)
VRRAREAQPDLPVEVECRDLAEVRAGAEAGADRLLLDNMSPAELGEAVAAAREAGSPELEASGGITLANGSLELEASGGITLANVAEIAATGVDYVSVGALTHSAPALDLSMTLIVD